jgi:hypothetical protein
MLIAMGVVMATPFACVNAENSESSRKSLQGVDKVFVAVDSLASDIEAGGLNSYQLKTDIELRLRKMGVRVVEGDHSNFPDVPVLYLKIDIFNAGEGCSNAYYAELNLYQIAYLYREPHVVSEAVTWSYGVAGLDPDMSSIRDKVKDVLDVFMNAYLSENPRETK